VSKAIWQETWSHMRLPPNGISMGSAVCAQQTHRPRHLCTVYKQCGPKRFPKISKGVTRPWVCPFVWV